MLFQIAKWFEFLSAFAVLLPFIALYYFLIKKPGKKQLQKDITLTGCYTIIATYFQIIVVITSLSGLHNLWLFHGFIAIELFFFSYILISTTNDKSIFLSLFLSIACYALSNTFDDPVKLPYISVLVQFFSIILIAPGAISNSILDRNTTDKEYNSYRDLLIRAILITTISNFVFISFIEKHLILILFIHSILNIYSNTLFTKAYKCYSETVL